MFDSPRQEDRDSLDLPIAFQPLMLARARTAFAWRATIPGDAGRMFETALAVLQPAERHALDCVRAALCVQRAPAALRHAPDAMLVVPLDAGPAGDAGPAAGADAKLVHLLRAAIGAGLPLDRITVEVSADERGAFAAAAALADACGARDIPIALSDFSAGPVGVRLLARHGPTYLMLDGALVRHLDASDVRRLIVDGVLRLARRTDATVVAPVADEGQVATLERLGIHHFRHDQLIAPGGRAQVRVPPRREPRGALGGGSPQLRRRTHHLRLGLSAGLPLATAASPDLRC